MNDSTAEALFESHLELALKIGRSFPIPNAAIDESEQEARIALWRAASSYDPAKGEFAGFASIVVRNHLRNIFNTAKRRGVEITALDAPSSDDPESEIDSAKNSLVSADASPLLDAERANIRLVLQTQLASLTEAQQQVLKSYADGESYAEISRRTGVSKAAVRQMVERAANQIRPELQARGISVQYMPAYNGNWDLPSQRGSASHRDRETPPKNTSLLWLYSLIGALIIIVILGIIYFR
ncbi:MAG: sigma-70 family RNA polymerase sigma factor [Spartobacteria bacterium]